MLALEEIVNGISVELADVIATEEVAAAEEEVAATEEVVAAEVGLYVVVIAPREEAKYSSMLEK